MAFDRTKGGDYGYIYYNTLLNDNRHLYDNAVRTLTNIANESIDLSNFDAKKTANFISQLANREREKERQYIIKSMNIDDVTDNLYEDQNLIKFYNEYLNLKSLWQKSVKDIKTLSDRKSKSINAGLKDSDILGRKLALKVNEYYDKHLQEELNKCIRIVYNNQKVLKDLIINDDTMELEKNLQTQFSSAFSHLNNEAIRYALSTLNLNKEGSAEYSEWEPVVQELMKNKAALDNLASQYSVHFNKRLESTRDNLIGQLTGMLKSSKRVKIKDTKKLVKNLTDKTKISKSHLAKTGGALAEHSGAALSKIHATIDSVLSGSASAVYSTDLLSVVTKIEIPDPTQLLIDLTKEFRSKNGNIFNKSMASEVNRMWREEIEKRDPEATFIYETIKSYDLGYRYQQAGGFHGTSMSYNSAATVLVKFLDKSPERMKMYFTVLMNTMEGAIFSESMSINKETETDRLTKALASYAGSLLFDDFLNVIPIGKKDNAIYLFRLNDIVIPFSVLLRGFAYAFREWDINNGAAKEWFSVTYETAYRPRERQEDESAEIAWTEQLKESISRFHITTTFFGNFVQYVTKYL